MENCSTDPSEDLAARMVRVRVQLALRQPFLASALFRLPLIQVQQTAWCSTMATDGIHIFYNPQWVSQLSDANIQAVMAHELLHVVMNHAGRLRDRDHRRWNLACDFCINGILDTMGFELPAGAALNRRFDRETSEEIYESLECDWKKMQKLTDAIGSDLVDAADPRVGAHIPADAPDEETARAVRTGLAETVRQALRASGAGPLSEREFEQTQSATVDWRAVLHNLLQSALVCDWASIPFAKKHLHRGLYLPSVSRPQALRVVFAIDTSGSVDDQQINDIMNELVCFASLHEGPVSIVQCDSEIRHVLHINDTPGERQSLSTLRIKGRGCTAFAPVFQWVQSNAQALGEVALLVYATDGQGEFPTIPPSYPVLWLLTQDGVKPDTLPFGTGVRIGR